MKNSLSWAAVCCLLVACGGGGTASTAKDTTAAAPATPAPPPQAEFADARYTDMGKKALSLFTTGDITGWLDQYTDDAKYYWSGGDSLIGKAAITKYWTERRGKVIDSIQMSNDIWLPLKVNRPQRGPDKVGIWVLSWYQVHVKYKNGHRLGFWVHMLNHYNSADKVDETVNYIDRAPINKALGVH